MNAEQLLVAFGQLDDDLIAQALRAPSKRDKRQFLVGIAACLCLVISSVLISSVFWGTGSREAVPSEHASTPGASSSGSATDASADGSTIHHFSLGPLLPLLSGEDNDSVYAEREIAFDFAPYGSKELLKGTFASDKQQLFDQYPTLKTSALVTDSYFLSGQSVETTFLYPFVSSYEDLVWSMPQISVNDSAVSGELIAGAKTSDFETWVDYTEHFPTYPSASIVPEFADEEIVTFSFPQVAEDNIYVHFEYDLENEDVQVFTEGVNRFCTNPATNDLWYGVLNSKSGNLCTQICFTNIDINDISCQVTRIDDGQSDSPIFGEQRPELQPVVAVQTLYDYLLKTVRDNWDDFNHQEGFISSVTPEQFVITLMQDGLDRFSGDIAAMIGSTATDKRIFYVAVSLDDVYSSDTVTLTIHMIKDGSYNRYGSGSGDTYDLITHLEKSLVMTKQTATVHTHGAVQIIAQNFGFCPEEGGDAVTLDPNIQHYYLEVVPIDS